VKQFAFEFTEAISHNEFVGGLGGKRGRDKTRDVDQLNCQNLAVQKIRGKKKEKKKSSG